MINKNKDTTLTSVKIFKNLYGCGAVGGAVGISTLGAR